MSGCSVRPTRVIYVENDPALRGIMTQLLEQRADIDVLLATGIAHEAIDQRLAEQADVALLDLALGSSQINGIDLGLALRGSWSLKSGPAGGGALTATFPVRSPQPAER